MAIAPHFMRDLLIGYAMTKAREAVPGTPIDKIEVREKIVVVSLENKQVVLGYRQSYRDGLGSDDFSVFVERVEDYTPTPSGPIETVRARKFVWYSVILAGAAGAVLGTTVYWLAVDWQRAALSAVIACLLSFSAWSLARTGLRSLDWRHP